MSVTHASTGKRQQARKELSAGQLLIVDLIPAAPGNNPEKQLGIILNLSEGGMAVQPFHPLLPGSVTDFRFTLPEVAGTPAGRGKVAWKSQGGRFGLRFLDTPLTDNNRLHDWLNRNFPNPEDDSPRPLSALTGDADASEFDTALRLIAYSAMTSTGASGAAIALGNSQDMVCRASVGIAPEVGTHLYPDTGLSGLCLRTGRIVSSGDARSDPRVDPSVAAQLDLRSLMILPIAVASRFAGLLEVFAKSPQAFNRRHLEQLQYMVSVLTQAIQENKAVPDLEVKGTAPIATILSTPLTFEETSAPVPALKEVETETEAGAKAGDSEQTYMSTAAMGGPVGVLTNSAGEMGGVTDLERAKPRHAWTRRPLFKIAAIGAAALLIFAAVWPVLRTNTRGPRSSASQSVQQLAPSAQGIASSGAGTVISFDPAEITQSDGATFTVNVVMQGARDASYVPLQILYDPEKLEVTGVSSGNLLERDGQKAALAHREDAVAGTIQIAASRPPTAPGISGDGVLVTLTFRSKVPGRSRLRVNQTELRDPASHLTSVNGIEALVNISPSPKNADKEPSKTAPKELRTAPAPTTPKASSTSPAPAAPTAIESKSAPAPATKESSNAEPSPKTAPESGSLLIEGVPQGSDVQVDSQAYTAIAQDGKVAIRNLPPGKHHLRISLHGFQYYDNFIELEPGQIIKIEPHTSQTVRPSQPVPAAQGSGANANAQTAFFPKMTGPPDFVLDRTLVGHSNWVTAVAFSADGQRLATGSWDKSVKLWDVASGEKLSTIASKLGGVQALAFSHDGRWLAVEDASYTVTIWNAETGAKIRVVSGDKPLWHKSWVYSIAFSPDGRWLAYGVNDRTVRVFDLTTGSVLHDLDGTSRLVVYVAFSPNGRWVATGGDSRSIVIWDAATGKEVRTLKGHKNDVYAVAFSPNGKLLASASKDRTVKLWDLGTGREIFTLTGHQGWVTSLAFSSNSRWLATSSWDKTTKIWDVNEGHIVQTLSGNSHNIYSLAFDSRGGWLATGSDDGIVKLWRLRRDIDLAVLDDESSRRTRASVQTSSAPAAHTN
jgi:GAF domain-containing protein